MGEQGTARCTGVVDFKPAPADNRWPEYVDHGCAGGTTDHFVNEHDRVYAGKHLILDFWGARELNNPEFMEETLRRCVDKAGATLLHMHLHRFSPSGGLSGVAVLAESHISVHTWPEKAFAAFDIFMCGDARPDRAADVLRHAFRPAGVSVVQHLRGNRHERVVR